MMHTYSAGSFASEGVRNWLEHSKVGQCTPHDMAMQMEGFTVSGCGNSIKTQDGMYQFLFFQYLMLTYYSRSYKGCGAAEQSVQ